MLPQIWIFDTYSIMILIGAISCFILYVLYAKKNKISRNYYYDILLLACISIIIGLVSASLFQLLFDALKENGEISIFSMTFFGGLVGGVIAFLIGYFYILKKKYTNESFISNVLIIAPACITIAHAFGRIGCFLAGCCYGIETDSIFGVTFPGMSHAVYPTQLFEATFLFILSAILFMLAYKGKFKYTFSIYLSCYGLFRFLLEFIRGDDRGAYFLSLSPSQWFSIIAFTISIVLFIWLKKKKISTN